MIKKIEHIGIAVKDIHSSLKIFDQLLDSRSYKTEDVLSEGVKTHFYQLLFFSQSYPTTSIFFARSLLPVLTTLPSIITCTLSGTI